MTGKTHSLLTAVTLINENEPYHYLNETKLTMKTLSEQFLQEYIERDKPLDCAGSYKIERAGISLFDHIECTDFTAITGLPLIELSKYLQKHNFMNS
jgi:septum formation protein